MHEIGALTDRILTEFYRLHIQLSGEIVSEKILYAKTFLLTHFQFNILETLNIMSQGHVSACQSHRPRGERGLIIIVYYANKAAQNHKSK